jgi:hypothetical protein
VRSVHLAEFVHLPEASAISLPTDRSSCEPSTSAGPPGAICRIMNLSPLPAPMDLSPCAPPSSRSCVPVEAIVFKHWDGGAVDRQGKRKRRNRPGVCLRYESRPTFRRGPLRRGRRSRTWKARRNKRSSRTKIPWHPADSISSGAMLQRAGEQEFRSVSKPADASAASPCRAGGGRRDSRSRAHKTFAER